MDTPSRVVELRCNVDDMTPEAIGLAIERLMALGALDVYVVPVVMKKNRPGHLIVLLCAEAKADEMAAHLFQNTSTIGIRKVACDRYVLSRQFFTVNTPYGPIRVKRSHGYGADQRKPEYDDCVKASQAHGVPFEQVRRAALEAAYSAACESEIE